MLVPKSLPEGKRQLARVSRGSHIRAPAQAAGGIHIRKASGGGVAHERPGRLRGLHVPRAEPQGGDHQRPQRLHGAPAGGLEAGAGAQRRGVGGGGGSRGCEGLRRGVRMFPENSTQG